MKNMVETESGTAELKLAVENFIGAMDKGDLSTIANTYDADFLNVRITDQGDVLRINRDEMLHLLNNWNGPQVETQSTTIHHLEVLGDIGFILFSRIKNMGNGWEPMNYCHAWKRENGKWFFLREFVYQKALPKTQNP